LDDGEDTFKAYFYKVDSMKLINLLIIVSFVLTGWGCAQVETREPVVTPPKTYPKPPPPVTVKPPVKPQPPKVPGGADNARPPSWATSSARAAPAPLSPVVVALMSDAERSSGSGNLDAAVATLERGLRIEPRNPSLIYKLAEVRLKQSQPKLAEELSRKADLLAGSDRALKRKCWLLIAEARNAQGNAAGAKDALLKANSL
jgi:hypothetical protein